MSYYAEGARCQARDVEGLQCELEAGGHAEHRTRAQQGGWWAWRLDHGPVRTVRYVDSTPPDSSTTNNEGA